MRDVRIALQYRHRLGDVKIRTTEDQPRGIRWTLFTTLEDLDFADDLALVSHTLHIQEKTSCVNRFAQQIGLNISLKKTKVMTLNTQNPPPIQINGINIPTTEEFSYLGSIVRYDGGTGNDIKSRLNKARNTFRMMNNVWKSTKYSINTKLKLYQSCVLSTLLYSSECWRMTEKDLSKISAFHTRILRIIIRIFWPNTISNQQLLARTNQESIETIITRRRWRWIGHIMRKEQDDITKTALHWTPEGKRKRGRPKETWRRTVEKELNAMKQTWARILKDSENPLRELLT